MKGIIIIFILGNLFLVCKGDKLSLTGKTGKLQGEKIYLYKVIDEYYNRYEIVDSATIKKGTFTFIKDDFKPELYFLGTSATCGGYLFLEPVAMQIEPLTIGREKIIWKVTGSNLDNQYRIFLQKKKEVSYQVLKDSLDQLFYKAREKNDKNEMARIKEESIPYYEKAKANEFKLAEELTETNRNNEFGIYTYYSRIFRFKSFFEKEGIRKERAYLADFGEQAKATNYFTLMMAKLETYDNCAIGAIAPDITGLDTLGCSFKLSDLRGNYVIVDFWNSYCHWCREETPWLQKTMDRFKDKNFKILGVSSDYIKKHWTTAIHEDKSYWNHLMLQKKNDVMDRYCIKGIPHIILIDPDGVILAKDLRLKEIEDTVAKYIK